MIVSKNLGIFCLVQCIVEEWGLAQLYMMEGNYNLENKVEINEQI